MTQKNQLKFAYFGTPYVARDTLKILYESGFIPSVVVTNPDAPRGRKHAMTPTETKELALSYNIPVLTPEKITEEVIEEIQSYGCEYAVVVAYGKILPEKLIQAFPKGVINIHYSLLPKYRGASPVESALLNNEKTTGVTIQQMVKKLDAGDILAMQEVKILPEETTKELRPKLVEIGAHLLVNTLPQYEIGNMVATPQNHDDATHVGKIKKEEGCLSLDDSAQLNWSKYRAYAEWPGTYFFQNGKRMKITKAELTESGEFRVRKVIPEGKTEVAYTN